MPSVDYDPTSDQSLCFQNCTNKVHYAITGSTAAEIGEELMRIKKAGSALEEQTTREIALPLLFKKELTQLKPW